MAVGPFAILYGLIRETLVHVRGAQRAGLGYCRGWMEAFLPSGAPRAAGLMGTARPDREGAAGLSEPARSREPLCSGRPVC